MKVKPFTEEPEGVAAYGPVETKDGARRFAIETKGMAKDLVICRKRDCRFVKTIDGTHFHRQCQDGHVDYRFAIVD